MLRASLVSLAFGLSATAGLAAVKTGFVEKHYKNADGHDSPYVVFVPHDYDGTKEVPVILFLHGSGETKGDKSNKMPVEVGIGTAIKKREKTFPFLTIIPRAEMGANGRGRTWGVNSDNANRALAMLDAVTKEYKTDPKKVYLTGLSMGGMGTWSIATAHPDMFAAIVPICGRGNPKQAEKLKDLPIWAFHGDADKSVNVSGSRDMIAAIKKAGGHPKFTEYPGVGHNSWDKAYGTDEMYVWLLKQSKK
jgi:predicted peptidase